MQGFDNVRGGVNLESEGREPMDPLKLFGYVDEDQKEGPDYARVLMNNHNNQIPV